MAKAIFMSVWEEEKKQKRLDFCEEWGVGVLDNVGKINGEKEKGGRFGHWGRLEVPCRHGGDLYRSECGHCSLTPNHSRKTTLKGIFDISLFFFKSSHI